MSDDLKLPWRVYRYGRIVDSHNYLVAGLLQPHHAEAIVKAVNAHHDQREAAIALDIRDRDRAFADGAMLRAEIQRMRGEIITYQDAHTTGTEIIDGLRAKVEALEPSDDVIELIRVAIDPDEPRLSGSCRAMVDVWLQRVEARKGGE